MSQAQERGKSMLLKMKEIGKDQIKQANGNHLKNIKSNSTTTADLDVIPMSGFEDLVKEIIELFTIDEYKTILIPYLLTPGFLVPTSKK